MKRIIPYFIVLFSFGVLSQCSEDDSQTEADNRRNNAIGNWDATMTEQFVRNNEVIDHFERDYDINLNSDGTGYNQNVVPGQTNVSFEWYYQFDPERFVLIYDKIQVFVGLQFFIFEIEINEPDMQTWTMITENPIGCFDCEYAKYTLTLTRE